MVRLKTRQNSYDFIGCQNTELYSFHQTNWCLRIGCSHFWLQSALAPAVYIKYNNHSFKKEWKTVEHFLRTPQRKNLFRSCSGHQCDVMMLQCLRHTAALLLLMAVVKLNFSTSFSRYRHKWIVQQLNALNHNGPQRVVDLFGQYLSINPNSNQQGLKMITHTIWGSDEK